jgi:hypothetical protein
VEGNPAGDGERPAGALVASVGQLFQAGGQTAGMAPVVDDTGVDLVLKWHGDTRRRRSREMDRVSGTGRVRCSCTSPERKVQSVGGGTSEHPDAVIGVDTESPLGISCRTDHG